MSRTDTLTLAEGCMGNVTAIEGTPEAYGMVEVICQHTE